MGTVLVCAVLVLIVGAIVYKMVKDKKSGKSPRCSGDCRQMSRMSLTLEI